MKGKMKAKGMKKGGKMKSKGYAKGGKLTLDPMSRKQSFIDSKDSGLKNVGVKAERDLGLRLHKGPGMKKGGSVKAKGMRKGGKMMSKGKMNGKKNMGLYGRK